MRKSSSQIYKEILLERSINALSSEAREEFSQCLYDLTNFKINELDALHTLSIYAGISVELNEYISSKIVEHAKRILAKQGGLTLDQFERQLAEEEDKYQTYLAKKGVM